MRTVIALPTARLQSMQIPNLLCVTHASGVLCGCLRLAENFETLANLCLLAASQRRGAVLRQLLSVRRVRFDLRLGVAVFTDSPVAADESNADAESPAAAKKSRKSNPKPAAKSDAGAEDDEEAKPVKEEENEAGELMDALSEELS